MSVFYKIMWQIPSVVQQLAQHKHWPYFPTDFSHSTNCKGRYTRGVLLPEHAPGSFCTCQYTRGSVFKFAQFAPGACSQIFNRLNIVEHFVGWKFCSRGWSIPMKLLVNTEELCSWSVPLEHAPGAKYLVCIGLNYQSILSNKKMKNLCPLVLCVKQYH